MPAARSLFILKIVIGKKPTVGAAVLILKVDSPNCKNYSVDERLYDHFVQEPSWPLGNTLSELRKAVSFYTWHDHVLKF